MAPIAAKDFVEVAVSLVLLFLLGASATGAAALLATFCFGLGLCLGLCSGCFNSRRGILLGLLVVVLVRASSFDRISERFVRFLDLDRILADRGSRSPIVQGDADGHIRLPELLELVLEKRSEHAHTRLVRRTFQVMPNFGP